ncbi:MAG TPA: CRISPR system precrRNA processing endoribonuclease RAMP protein Cas6 [bacterium (Candidatus Stahlbacteria)]|nr:CRISPR system precrRNA processing endoribonuclease RAMP protein Cas6 [Candidatus Stahlbacteria bacterium]
MQYRLPKNLRITTFAFTLTPLEEIILPAYAGAAIRGGFGYAFKKIACVSREKDCNTCMLRGKCIYSYTFESPTDNKGHQYVPQPFVIEPPEMGGKFVGEDELVFRLTLIGKAIEYLPYFIYTFEELGQVGLGKGRGRYKVVKVTSNGKTIYSGESKTLENKEDMIRRAVDFERISSKCNQLTINFLTPTRIKYRGKLTKDINFEILMKSLLRRISLLSRYHCDEKWRVDFNSILSEAKKIETKAKQLNWYDWERYSKRQNTRMKLGGFLGKLTVAGDLNSFMPILKVGEYIHVGKATTFGLGKYKVQNMKKG